MSRYDVKLPDVGEGVAQAELVAWLVGIGEHVGPETPIVEVLTDKATVEVVAPTAGRVVELLGDAGDVVAVGSVILVLDVDLPHDAEDGDGAPDAPVIETLPEPAALRRAAPTPRASAAPAVRARAASLGIELGSIQGSGPDGRVLHADLDRVLRGATSPNSTTRPGATVVPIRGVRRRISERLTKAWQEIPHITYVDEVDVTELETLRLTLNEQHPDRTRLSPLAFIALAVVRACHDDPRFNAHHDAPAEQLVQFGAVHLGIATQTDDGLLVPVVRSADRLGLWGLADEIARLARATRETTATREELTGSTITITSLGALGGLATTPIINAPEVAIVGVNRMERRPVWRDGAAVGRLMMNLSCSFDHRVIDGWDAAVFVGAIKTSLESPATLFVD